MSQAPPPPPGGLGGAPPGGGPVGYYTPPANIGGRPAAIMWFRVYAIASALAVLGFLEVWQFLTPHGSTPMQYFQVFLLACPFLLIYGIGAAVPYKPWGWTYALILIGLGMLGCLAPFSIILVIMWSRPPVKAAFGRV